MLRDNDVLICEEFLGLAAVLDTEPRDPFRQKSHHRPIVPRRHERGTATSRHNVPLEHGRETEELTRSTPLPSVCHVIDHLERPSLEPCEELSGRFARRRKRRDAASLLIRMAVLSRPVDGVRDRVLQAISVPHCAPSHDGVRQQPRQPTQRT